MEWIRKSSQFLSTVRICSSLSKKPNGEQGWRSGESTRLPPMWPGFDSRSRCHMWVEFAVGSRPCSEGFSPGTPVFLPPQKPTFPNSNSSWKQWREEPLRGFHWNSYLFILFYFISLIGNFGGIFRKLLPISIFLLTWREGICDTSI